MSPAFATLRWIALALLLLTLSAVLVGLLAYRRDMAQAYHRIAQRGTVVASPQGDIEFTQGGTGWPVLVVHGSGGGYDQSELLAHAVLDDQQQHWIAPSRMGYLRSTLRPGATFDDQAHAYAHLLDHLGIAQVAVVALSHGGPSALLFAALYPERVSSLVLLSCGVASSADPSQTQANDKGNALTRIFQHDALYWLVSTLFHGPLMKLMGASDDVIADLPPTQRQLVTRLIDHMNPVAPRAQGVALDNRAAMPNERIVAVQAPTLVLHATDDLLQLFHNAEFAAAHIPQAQLVPYTKGGHLLVAVEQADVRQRVQRFLAANPAR